MFSSTFTAFALSQWLAAAPAPEWQRDYTAAQAKALKESRPLAVVIGSGKDGFEKLAREGTLGAEVSKVLLDQYVCVYLDKSQPSQTKLIGELSIKEGTGIIISDRKMELMAFHHDGTLTQTDLKTHLRHFANPALVVRGTTTHTTARYSYYPPASSPTTTVRC